MSNSNQLHEDLVQIVGEAGLLPDDQLNRYAIDGACLLYTSPSPRDGLLSRMPSSA